MGRNSKILIASFVLVVLASISATYYRYVILEDITYTTDEAAFQEALLEE